MRGVFSAVEMTLVLNVVGSVSPTEFTTDGSLLHCEGLNNQSYICESGHCCGESKCCSYYYELWWFWLVWAIILILSCCCICHHRRTKHRLQQQQRQHEINLIAYREAHNYTSVPFYFRFLPNYLLPDYEEVVNRPLTPPPPYSALHTVSSTLPSCPLSGEQQESHCPAVQSSPAAPDSDALRPRPGLEDGDPGGVGFFLPKLADKPPHAAQYSGTITRSEGGAGSEKGERGGAGDSRKEPMPPEPEGRGEEKRLLPAAGRRRRFTGDSGIEVCVCGARGPSGAGAREGRELKELESLLGCTEDEDEDEEVDGVAEFCESCGPRAHLGEGEEEGEEEEEEEEGEGQAREEPQRGADQLPSADPQPAHQTSSSSSSSSSISSSNAPPMCALTHTINEQEGPRHGNEPQGCSQ